MLTGQRPIKAVPGAPIELARFQPGTGRTVGFIAKKAATSLTKRKLSPRNRLELCLSLLTADGSVDPTLAPFLAAIRPLSVDEQHYWIGTFYTLLLGQDERKRRSAYFTPPEIARHMLRLVESEGIDLSTAHVLDPAAGGAAFLSMVAGRMCDLGCSSRDILKRLRGIELDPMLASLARRLIAERLGCRSVPSTVVTTGDSLQADIRKRFDLVLANPPYGRLFQDELLSDRWQEVCHPGHINKYALFADFCLERVKPQGIVGLIIPSSFIAGPLYSRLRQSFRDRALVKILGQVQCRDEFFFDVTQDTSLLILQRKEKAPSRPEKQTAVTFGHIENDGSWKPARPINLPAAKGEGWLLPMAGEVTQGGAVLADYGCNIKTGYFVWNREQDRMSKRRTRKSVPLFWACNIRPNISARPNAKDGKGIDYVRFDGESAALIRGPSLLLQRTTNTKQARRLIAARVDEEPYITSGYVGENHTIVVLPSQPDTDLDLVCKLLNSAPVDKRYRQISGTASISTLLLRQLDLPTPQNLLLACRTHKDLDVAVEAAYAMSIATPRKAAS